MGLRSRSSSKTTKTCNFPEETGRISRVPSTGGASAAHWFARTRSPFRGDRDALAISSTVARRHTPPQLSRKPATRPQPKVRTRLGPHRHGPRQRLLQPTNDRQLVRTTPRPQHRSPPHHSRPTRHNRPPTPHRRRVRHHHREPKPTSRLARRPPNNQKAPTKQSLMTSCHLGDKVIE